MDLPAREELESLVRRYRVPGYELDDLVQEAYLCLLDPDSDHDIHRHMRRLARTAFRRKAKAVQFPEREYDPSYLVYDDTKQRTREDLEALTLMIAAESECESADEEKLLKLLSEGASYRDLCDEWHCNRATARQRVSRFRRELELRVYEEDP